MVRVGSRRVLISLACLCGFSFAAEYKDGDKVPVYVNKVGPYANPQETYHYYQLPVCRPLEIVHKSLSLGEVLNGDRMAESLYDISFQHSSDRKPLCPKIKLDDAELRRLVEAIEENYYFEFVIDDLPVRNYVGRLAEETVFPHTHKLYLFTHHHFIIEFNGYNVIAARVDARDAREIVEGRKMTSIEYTYSVEWRQTRMEYKNRAAAREGDVSFFPKTMEIHWLSVLNSTLLVLLLVGFIALILVRVVRSDLTRYNQSADYDDSDLDNGWKVINGDVFRYPPHPNLFCAILGAGCQLLTIVFTILLIGAFNLINVHRHGLINSAAVVLYALTSGIGSYVSASLYARLGGTHWVRNINLTSALFSVPMFLVWCVENAISWAYHSTQALPYTTIALLIAMWLLVGYPLAVLGGVLGRNFAGKYAAPCRARNIPRELPRLPCYQSAVVFSLIGGFLPFSAISVELYYVFATVWGHETYTLFYVLLLVFAILLAVTACVSVALAYFQLAAEDYRWWWRSVFSGGSTGLFVLLYAVFFYARRSEMSGLMQTAQFFGYVALLCYGFFLALATVSFFAAHRFVRFIYGSVKTD